MTDAITAGSLAARVLEHMRIARGEFEAGEISEALQVDLAETRKALSSLRTSHLVSMRNEDGHPLYRAVGTEPNTIPGSARQVIEEQPATRGRPANPKPPEPRKETAMPKQKGPPQKRPGHMEAVLAFLKSKPGGHSRGSVMAGTGLTVAQVRVALRLLAEEKRVSRTGNTSNSIWCLPGEKVTATPPPPPNKAPRNQAKPNLASYGAASKVARGADVELAMDARGILAIDSMRLRPPQIERLLDFLTRTQHVWKEALA